MLRVSCIVALLSGASALPTADEETQCASWCNRYVCAAPQCSGCSACDASHPEFEHTPCEFWCNSYTCPWTRWAGRVDWFANHCSGCEVCNHKLCDAGLGYVPTPEECADVVSLFGCDGRYVDGCPGGPPIPGFEYITIQDVCPANCGPRECGVPPAPADLAEKCLPGPNQNLAECGSICLSGLTGCDPTGDLFLACRGYDTDCGTYGACAALVPPATGLDCGVPPAPADLAAKCSNPARLNECAADCANAAACDPNHPQFQACGGLDDDCVSYGACAALAAPAEGF